ncbi:zinc-binding dehydrogenase [Rhodococcus sp. NPDC057014]|uniref:zinc-dependent alcohol dehydrogenase n=1 Tax=Rhodococcus sp. NPDC057014 TaxID=3346000 RepID=UPI0036440C5B
MQTVSAVVVDKTAAGEITVSARSVPTREPGPGELLVRPEFVGVCGSDLELLDGNFELDYPVTYPVILGHEWSGTVLAVGAGVEDYAVGDLIVGHGSLGNNHWFGLTSDGAMAEAFTVPRSLCFHVPGNVGAQQAALAEPLACVIEGLHRIGGADPSHISVVFGCGTLGLAMIGLLHQLGCPVVAIDPSEQRRAIARNLGADLTLDPTTTEPREEIVARLGAAADLVVEASGSPLAQASALDVTADRARVLYMGLTHGTAHNVALRQIQARDLRIQASSGAPPTAFASALRLMARTGLDLTPAVSTIFPFTACTDAITAARNPAGSGKVMLAPAVPGPADSAARRTAAAALDHAGTGQLTSSTGSD